MEIIVKNGPSFFNTIAGIDMNINRLRENRLIFNIYQIYKYIIFFPLVGLSTILSSAVSLPLIIFLGQKYARFGGVLWSRINSFLTPMSVTVTGKDNIDPRQSYVIVANHQSQYDIFAIYGWLPLDFRWVMKKELRKVPVIGFMSEHAGHVCIDRSNPVAAVASINAAKKRIVNGTSIFFFPEGTRSLDGELLPFKKGAFRLALDMGLPILPITISGTRDILPSNTLALFPGSARLMIHKPIDVSEYTDKTLDQLTLKTQNVIQNGLMKDRIAHS